MMPKNRLIASVESPAAMSMRTLFGLGSLHSPASARAAKRPGAVLLILLVCLMVATMIAGSLLSSAVSQRGEVLRNQRELQAIWLAEAGLERAAARLTADPTYTGEDWPVSAEDVGGSHAGAVQIRIEPVADQPLMRAVVARADYPAGADARARKTLQARITLTAAGERP